MFCCYFVFNLSQIEHFSLEAKEAARMLGYDERQWEKGEDTAATKKDWCDLTDDEKKAAVVLGYDEEMWDED